MTGSGHSKRGLYTNDGEVIYHFRRVTGLTAISCSFLLRPDALERSLLVRMNPIGNAQRKTKQEIQELLKAALPEALGACFDAIVRALAIHPTVRSEEAPHMADFFHWGIAIAEALRYGPGV